MKRVSPSGDGAVKPLADDILLNANLTDVREEYLQRNATFLSLRGY